MPLIQGLSSLLTFTLSVNVSPLLFGTMQAAGPAARAAHAAFQFRNTDLDATLPRLGFLGIHDPANPFVARQWRDILP